MILYCDRALRATIFVIVAIVIAFMLERAFNEDADGLVAISAASR